MTRWLAAARQATDARTKLTKPTKPRPDEVSSVLSVLSEVAEAARPADAIADALDYFQERAAIREHDGRQTRAEAEAAALIEAAEACGIPADELRDALTKRRPPDPDTNENSQSAKIGD